MLVFSRLPPPELFFSPDASARKPEAMRAAAIQMRRRATDIATAMNHKRASMGRAARRRVQLVASCSELGDDDELCATSSSHLSSFTPWSADEKMASPPALPALPLFTVVAEL